MRLSIWLLAASAALLSLPALAQSALPPNTTIAPDAAKGAVDLDNPAVQAVLALRAKAAKALREGDAAAFGAIIDDGFVASDPSNTIQRRDEMVGYVSKGQLRYRGIDTALDFAGQVADDIVVLMGVESSRQSAVPPGAKLPVNAVGSVLHRRFTDVYRREGGAWKQLIKQSTIIGSEPVVAPSAGGR